MGGGAFTELGPFFPRGDGRGLRRNSMSWNRGIYISCDMSLSFDIQILEYRLNYIFVHLVIIIVQF